MKKQTNSQLISVVPVAAIIVASLGYFVDIYDLLLFSIVRLQSLRSIGLDGDRATASGIFLLNVQMAGLLTGAIFWGVLGDKKGRLTVLFGSISIYSLANIGNAFVHSVDTYSFFRFIAGFGLAGELGAGITLVTELMPTEKRGYATTIIAGVGISGAVVAHFVVKFFDWRNAFLCGGGLGLLLLILRIGVSESALFKKSGNETKSSIHILALFVNRNRFFKYLRCIMIGLPLWFGVGILITLSPEFGKELRVNGAVNAGVAVACCYGGTVIGDVFSGLLSQYLKSRIKVVLVFLSLTTIAITCYLSFINLSLAGFYAVCGFFGFVAGYWVLFLTIAAEQFGTNIRATVSTTVPNFVRAAVIPLSLLFQYCRTLFGGSMLLPAAIVGGLTIIAAFWAISDMRETFSDDMDFQEI